MEEDAVKRRRRKREKRKKRKTGPIKKRPSTFYRSEVPRLLESVVHFATEGGKEGGARWERLGLQEGTPSSGGDPVSRRYGQKASARDKKTGKGKRKGTRTVPKLPKCARGKCYEIFMCDEEGEGT